MNALSEPNPAAMTAGQVNKELDSLDLKMCALLEEFIAAGRGDERASETWRKTDPLAERHNAIARRQDALRREISRRYGPGAPARMPKGFKPRERP